MAEVERIKARGKKTFGIFESDSFKAWKKKYEESVNLGTTYSTEEAKAIKDTFGVTVKTLTKEVNDSVSKLETAQKELTAEIKKSNQSVVKQQQPVNNTTNVTNQTIIPQRFSVKPSDDSFNRYISTMFAN
jgi:transposase-like protein